MGNNYFVSSRAIQEEMPQGFAHHKILLDDCGNPVDFIYLKVNSSYERLTGMNEEQIVGKRFSELLVYSKDDEFDYIGNFCRVAITGESLQFEFYTKALNKWFSVFAYSDRYLHFSTIFHDITERKNLFNELQKANYLNEILLDAIPHPALLIHKDRTVIASNKIARDAGSIVGGFCWRDWGGCRYLSAEDKKRKTNYKLGSEETIHCNFCKGDAALEKNESVNIKKKLDDIFWDIYWVPTQEKDTYLHYAIDITEQKKIEMNLRESELRFKQLTEATFEGICILRNGTIIDCNKRIETMFGYSTNELIGSPLTNLVICGLKEKKAEKSENATPVEVEYFGVKKDGTKFNIEILTKEMLYKGDQAEVFVLRDITEWKKAENLLKETNEKLIKVSQFKTEFLRNMSHELRTPLTAIMALASSFQMKQFEYNAEKNGEYIASILKKSKQLLGLINDLLDLSKAESGRMMLNLSEVKIGDITSDVVKVLKPLASERGIQIHADIKDVGVVIADSDKVGQVITNILGNAIKFSRATESVEIAVFSSTDQEGTHVKISDSGPGIPEEELDNIFEDFYQINRGLNRKYQGTGLGLAIAKKIVDMHLGKIKVSNRMDESGAIFTIFWPSYPMFENDLD